MYRLNLLAGWIGILACFATGAVQGLFFADADWLGGYGSWERRMMRLGHISLGALGLVNIAAWQTAEAFDFGIATRFIAAAFLVALVTMPTICYLSAFRRRFRHVFFIPVLCLLGGATVIVRRIL